jgi:Protein of unknown function (DUF1565)
MKKLFVFIFLLISSQAISQVITIKQDGSGDFTRVQDGIDIATQGDTVLVYPGTYFENIEIVEKNIVLGSLCLTTGDESYISQTIIDGSQLSCCIYLNNNTELNIICGFTLQNGSGYKFEPDDIYSTGGALFIWQSDINLIDCILKNNKADGHGGAIYIYQSTMNSYACVIEENYAFFGDGGGISARESELFLSDVTIKKNYSSKRGGGILYVNTTILWDSINPCSIFLNHGTTGTDISKGANCPALHLHVDTFTVADPDRYYIFSTMSYAYPVNDVTYDIKNWVVERENHDLYVNPSHGNNENSGLSPDQPLKNIYYALLKIVSDSLDPKSIYLADGIYSPSAGEKFPMPLRHYVSLIGESRDSSIIDAQDTAYHLYGNAWTNSYSIKNLTLRNGNGNKIDDGFGSIKLFDNNNINFENLLLKNNKGKKMGTTAMINSNRVNLKNVIFENNLGQKTIGFYANANEWFVPFYTDTVNLTNCQFIGNTTDPEYPYNLGGGVTAGGINQTRDSLICYLTNCLFYDNISTTPPPPSTLSYNSLGILNAKVNVLNCTFGNNLNENFAGANICVLYKGELNIYNSILSDNDYAEFYLTTQSGWGTPALNIYNSIVKGGKENIRIYTDNYHLHYDSSNINTDPLWDTTGFFPYSPTFGSPCINAGTTDLPEGWKIPETDLAGNPRVYDGQIDMGAYEFGPWVGIDYQKPKANSQNLRASPNPFCHETRIRYQNKEKGKQCIFVYDINANRVATLMDITGQPGSGEIIWDGKNDYGRELPAGVYIVEFIVNEKSKGSVKVVKE